MPSHCASQPFVKLPSSLTLPYPSLYTQKHKQSKWPYTHSFMHTQLNSGTLKQTSRQKAKHCLQKEFLLSPHVQQTWLSHSLYSFASFCVSLCFNLNGFQVPSLPKSACPLLASMLLLTIKQSPISSLSLSSFSSLSLSPQETSQHATIARINHSHFFRVRKCE